MFDLGSGSRGSGGRSPGFSPGPSTCFRWPLPRRPNGTVSPARQLGAATIPVGGFAGVPSSSSSLKCSFKDQESPGFGLGDRPSVPNKGRGFGLQAGEGCRSPTRPRPAPLRPMDAAHHAVPSTSRQSGFPQGVPAGGGGAWGAERALGGAKIFHSRRRESPALAGPSSDRGAEIRTRDLQSPRLAR